MRKRLGNRGQAEVLVTIIIILFVLGLIGAGMAGCPKYTVWQKGLAGKSQLKEAEWNRRITIQEANAKKESAALLAEAEVIRAGGIAEANEIIGKSITDAYLKYKFIEGLNDGNTEVIYVPTETNLPILEARDERVKKRTATHRNKKRSNRSGQTQSIK